MASAPADRAAPPASEQQRPRILARRRSRDCVHATGRRFHDNDARGASYRRPERKFRIEERELPQPARHEVRLRVQACGVCHSDALTVGGRMPGLKYPRIPGHEVIGTSRRSVPDVDGWTTGTRVGVGWSSGACGYCLQLPSRRCVRVHQLPRRHRRQPRWRLCHAHAGACQCAGAGARRNWTRVASAPLLCAGITTFNALRHCGARAGELVAIHGVGGLGHLGIQFAARLGFRVVAVSRGSDKEELARSLGAHEYIDTERGDPAAALRSLGGARAILATVTDARARCSRSSADSAPTAR